MKPERTITALEWQKRNKERVNLYLDGEFAFGLSAIEAAKLRKGQTLSQAEITALRHEDAVQQAVDRAANFLSYRPRSTQEVRRNLSQKGTPPPVIEVTIERLNALGYLDDCEFARYWVKNRNTFKPRGPRALRYELRQKGVSSAVINETIDEMVDEDVAACEAARSKVRGLRGNSHREFKRRLSNFLQRRGFNYSTINNALEQLIEELETDDPDYFTSEESE